MPTHRTSTVRYTCTDWTWFSVASSWRWDERWTSWVKHQPRFHDGGPRWRRPRGRVEWARRRPSQRARVITYTDNRCCTTALIQSVFTLEGRSVKRRRPLMTKQLQTRWSDDQDQFTVPSLGFRNSRSCGGGGAQSLQLGHKEVETKINDMFKKIYSILWLKWCLFKT